MQIVIKNAAGEWMSAWHLLGADCRSDVRSFLDGYVKRLAEDGIEAKIVSEKKRYK